MSSRSVAPAQARPPLSLARKAALAAEVLVTYARVRRAWDGDILAMLERLRADAGSAPPEAPAERLADARRLGRAVARTLTLVPTDTRCLFRGLVLASLLGRRGIRCSLVIGVRLEPEFAAHAWVEHDGVALLPPGSAVYRRLVAL